MTKTQTPRLQPIAWLGLQFAAPSDWEILRHSTRTERGELMFADERDGRLHVAWARAQQRPDVERLLSDYRAKHLEEDAGSVFESLPRMGLVEGYRWRSGGKWVTRGGLYDAAGRRWIELTLPWPKGLEKDLERTVLESVRIVDERRWCAFGLEVRYPEGWVVSGARAEPGLLTVRLAGERGEATVRRYRALAAWYDGDARALVKRELNGRRCEFEEGAYRGRQAVLGRTTEPGPGWRKLLGGLRRRTDVVWENPQRKSVYQLTVVGKKRQEVQPQDFAVEDVSQEVCR